MLTITYRPIARDVTIIYVTSCRPSWRTCELCRSRRAARDRYVSIVNSDLKTNAHARLRMAYIMRAVVVY